MPNQSPSGIPGGGVFTLDPEPMYRRARVLQWLFLGFAVILLVLIMLLVVRASEAKLAGGSAAVVLGGSIFTLGVAAGIWAALGLGRGADSCRMTAGGFTLVYRTGRTAHFSWTDPALRFAVTQLLSRDQLSNSLGTRRPFLNPIPQELYQEILSEAHDHGLRVVVQTSTLSSGHQIKTRIRAAKHIVA